MAASTTTTTASASSTAIDREKTLQEELALPILLTKRVIKSAGEAESSSFECADIARQADELSQKLRAAVRLISSSPSTIYDRPIRRIAADVSKNLERALTLVRKCKHSGFLRHVFLTITSSLADFRKVSNLLQSSIADFGWLLSLYNDDDDDDGGGANLGLPPIVSNDPIFAWVWSSIASLQTNRKLKDRIDSANYLAELARQNQRYRKVIVEEGAVSPLLKLLKEGCGGSTEGQIVASNALCCLVDEKERTRIVAAEGGIPVIVQVLGEACMSVQVVVAELVAQIAEIDLIAREEFGKENVLKPLISCLIMDVDMEEYKQFHGGGGKTSIHSIVQKELAAKNNHQNYSNHSLSSGNSSYHKVYSNSSMDYSKKSRENESPEVKLKLKINCALALWRLCHGSMLNSQKIAEPKGLFCLSKIIETEGGELQYNCLMTIMKVAEVAEDSADLRKVSWKPSSPPAKAVLDQLLRVMKGESSPDLQIPAIKAIGCLARIFPAKERGIVNSLVDQLGNINVRVATEAAIALAKFACPDTYNCVAHSKTIIEFNGVPLLMRFLRMSDPARKHGLVLLCYLSMHVGNSKELAEARALRTIESAVRSGMAQNAEIRDILLRAVHHLMLYQDGSHQHKYLYEP